MKLRLPARGDKPTKDKRRADWVGLVAFIIVIALLVGVGPQAGFRAFGLWMMLTALWQQWTGRLPISWDGPPPSRRMMAILNLTVAALGFIVAAWPEAVLDWWLG